MMLENLLPLCNRDACVAWVHPNLPRGWKYGKEALMSRCSLPFQLPPEWTDCQAGNGGGAHRRPEARSDLHTRGVNLPGYIVPERKLE